MHSAQNHWNPLRPSRKIKTINFAFSFLKTVLLHGHERKFSIQGFSRQFPGCKWVFFAVNLFVDHFIGNLTEGTSPRAQLV